MIPRALRRILAPQPWEFCTPLLPVERVDLWKRRRDALAASEDPPEVIPEVEPPEARALRQAVMDGLREQAAAARKARRARRNGGTADGSDS